MKIIIITLVSILGLGGGAFYAQDSGLFDFKELIPTQVQELLNIEDSKMVSVSLDELEDETVRMVAANDPQNQNMHDFGSEQQTGSYENQSMVEAANQQVPNSNADNEYSIEEKQVADNRENNTSEIIPLGINQGASQQAMVNGSQPTPPERQNMTSLPRKADVQVLDGSPEDMKLVKELSKIESNIVMLDNENEDLQTKYDKMIKKNRELAMKIRDIDLQIKAIDSQ